MDWLFVVPLSISLVSGYIAQNSEDEITYLTGTVAAVSLVLSLILAPWQIQLFILLFAILGTRQFWLKFEQKENTKVQDSSFQGEANPKSKIQNPKSTDVEAELKNIQKYRGALYDPHPEPTTTLPKQVVKKYRGAPIVSESEEEHPAVLPHVDLKYRGVKIPPSQTDEVPKINSSFSPTE